jgi:hypothetical protein
MGLPDTRLLPNARSLGVENRWKLPHVGEQYSFNG